MAENKQDGIAVFDTLFTNNHICMMKLLLPLLSPSMQKGIAIYIKFQELQYTLQYFTRHPLGLVGTNIGTAPADTNAVLDSILPFCAEKERQSLTQMKNMLQTMQNLKDMMEMMETMKELFPEGFAGSGDGVGMDFSQMAEMFSAGSGNGNGMDFSQMAEMFSAGSGNGNGMDFSQIAEMFSASSGNGNGMDFSQMAEMFSAFGGGGISPDIMATFGSGCIPTDKDS